MDVCYEEQQDQEHIRKIDSTYYDMIGGKCRRVCYACTLCSVYHITTPDNRIGVPSMFRSSERVPTHFATSKYVMVSFYDLIISGAYPFIFNFTPIIHIP